MTLPLDRLPAKAEDPHLAMIRLVIPRRMLTWYFKTTGVYYYYYHYYYYYYYYHYYYSNNNIINIGIYTKTTNNDNIAVLETSITC